MTKAIRKAVHCPCGVVIRADDEAALIAAAQQHAREVHRLDLSPAQVLAMAQIE